MSKNYLAISHTPVLSAEVLKMLAVQPGGRYIDCTINGAGHASIILENSMPGGQLLGIDADPKAIESAREKLQPYQDSVLLVNDNFVNLQAICIKSDFFPVHGILFDLGLSSLQLNGNGRGFSFQHDAPLDVLLKRIVENERLCLREQQEPTQHIVSADVVDDVRPRVFVPGGYAKVMISKAGILPQVRLSSGKRKNA